MFAFVFAMMVLTQSAGHFTFCSLQWIVYLRVVKTGTILKVGRLVPFC